MVSKTAQRSRSTTRECLKHFKRNVAESRLHGQSGRLTGVRIAGRQVTFGLFQDFSFSEQF